MKKKLLRKIINPHIYTDMAVIIVMSLIILNYSTLIGILCFAALLIGWFVHNILLDKFAMPVIDRFEEKLIDENSGITESFRMSSVEAYCVVNRLGRTIWSNAKYADLFSAAPSVDGLIDAELLEKLFESDEEHQSIVHDDRTYFVYPTIINTESDRIMLTFRDVTYGEQIKKLYNDSRDCIAVVNIDNYDEIMSSTPLDEQSGVNAQIDRQIRNWASSMGAAAIQYSNSRYTIILEEKDLAAERENKFKILNEMHEIETGADFPTSISIGVASKCSNMEELMQEAMEALDLALGRGGDQAVVRGEKQETEYYGGSLPSVEKRNKSRTRIISHAIISQMRESDSVIVMGHSRPDMDSFGASVGMAAFAAIAGKEAYIVLNEVGEAIEQIYDAAVAEDKYRIVTEHEAQRIMTDNSLLVIVDCHVQALTEAPSLVDNAKKTVVIDHHRRSNSVIENITLSCMETYASSTSELVAELIQYAGEKDPVSDYEANALLAGITVDSKNFTVMTGVRTFEAASWLRRRGADNVVVRSFFKQRLEFIQKKYNIIASTQIIGNGIAIAYTKETDPAMQVLTAQAADELLDMRGVTAAFTAGMGADKTMLSARSLGQINVQTIMEEMGGGGHMTAAATQLSCSPEEAIQQLVDLLREKEII